MKLLFWLALFVPSFAHAFPVLDEAIGTGGYPIRVYRDDTSANMYWYIPISVEPWKKDGNYRSSLYKSEKALSFTFRGQASVDEDMLSKVAKAMGVSKNNLTPIAYEYSKDLTCQDAYLGDPQTKWLFPKMIGNYLEVVPVTIRTENPDLIDELAYHIEKGGGLACTVSVGFKGTSTAYKVHVEANFNQIYERFEAAAHAESFWWEVDIHTLIQSLQREGLIKITSLEDASLPQSELDKKLQASLEGVMKKIIEAMFTPALKIPSGGVPDRGKPFSLRVDYVKSSEKGHWEATLESNKRIVKDSQIGLRLAIE